MLAWNTNTHNVIFGVIGFLAALRFAFLYHKIRGLEDQLDEAEDDRDEWKEVAGRLQRGDFAPGFNDGFDPRGSDDASSGGGQAVASGEKEIVAERFLASVRAVLPSVTDVDDSHAAIGDTRACPWCAETIKAAAIICRFCGREVTPHK